MVRTVIAVWMVLAVTIGFANITPSLGSEALLKDQITRRLNINPGEYLLDFSDDDIVDRGRGGNLRGETVRRNRILGLLPNAGGAFTRVTLGPCGVQLPHYHPRGTEFSFVYKGRIIQTFIEEDNSRSVRHEVNVGQVFINPEGTIHFSINPTCEESIFLAFFPFSDQGATFLHRHLFSERIPDNVLRAALPGLTSADIGRLRASVANNPGIDEQCARRCEAAMKSFSLTAKRYSSTGQNVNAAWQDMGVFP